MLTEEYEAGYCEKTQIRRNIPESVEIFVDEDVEDDEDEDGLAEEQLDRERKRQVTLAHIAETLEENLMLSDWNRSSSSRISRFLFSPS